MTITVEKLFDMGLITERMHKAAAEEGIESVELSQGGLTSIKGVGNKRAESILDEFEDELAQEDTQEEEETTTKEEEGDKVEENDNKIILKDVGIVKEARVNAFYLGDESVTLDGKTYVADITVTIMDDIEKHIQVSLKDGELIQESAGALLNGSSWSNVKQGLLHAYREELKKIDAETEEVLISGEQLQEAVQTGIVDYYVVDVNYKEELTDKDLVGTVVLQRTDGTSIYGDAVFYDGKLEFNFEDALTKVTVDKEVPGNIKSKLLSDLRREYKKAEAEFNKQQREIYEAENPGEAAKRERAPKKEEGVNEIKTEGVNPVARTKDDKEIVKVVDGMVTQVNGRRLIDSVPAAEYFADRDYGTKKDTVKSTPENTPKSTENKKRAPKNHGLKKWTITTVRDDVTKDISNGTLVAELALEAVNGKKAQFAAVYYDGALRFFNKDGKSKGISNKTTADFLTDQIREAYGLTK